MIYRITVVTSKRDFVRSAVDKYFQDYLITEADSYKNNEKRMALVLDIEGKIDGSDVGLAYDAVNKVVEVVGINATLQIIDRCSILASIASPAKPIEPQPKKESD